MATTTLTGAAGPHATVMDSSGALSTVGRLVQEFTVSWRRARLREQLARMTARELMDIGIAEEELERIYALEVFTPRRWAAEGVNLA